MIDTLRFLKKNSPARIRTEVHGSKVRGDCPATLRDYIDY